MTDSIRGTLPWETRTADAPTRYRRDRATYGRRDTRCEQCKQLFRKADIICGICIWCEYDNQQKMED